MDKSHWPKLFQISVKINQINLDFGSAMKEVDKILILYLPFIKNHHNDDSCKENNSHDNQSNFPSCIVSSRSTATLFIWFIQDCFSHIWNLKTGIYLFRQLNVHNIYSY